MVAIILFLRFRSSQLCYKLELNYHIPDQLYQNLCGWDPDIAFGKALQIIPCVVKVENHCSIHPKKNFPWDFPGGPVVKTPCFQCRGRAFDPSSGN